MLRKLVLILVVVFAITGLFALPATTVHAGTLVSQAIVLTCTNLSGPITFTADRDNTGSGAERFAETVSDGQGVLITGTRTVPIGSNDTITGNAPLPPIRYNPVTYRLYSVSGNGQAEQTLYTVSITCSNLPSLNAGCSVPEGAYQSILTKAVKLYWDKDEKKNVTPDTYIPAGMVVNVVDNVTPGWVRINWACGYYYIKSGNTAPNPAKVTKPHLVTR